MQWQAVFRLGVRMAQRNHLYLFAWLCALVLPALLQVVAWQVPDIRDYVGEYFGVATLYIFFVLTFSCATIFVSYYQATGYRLAGTLDLLRTAGFSPGALLGGVFLQLQQVLGPPLLAFLAGLALYARLDGAARGWMGSLSLADMLGIGLLLALNQAILCALLLLGLLRRGELLALGSLLLVMPLNILPLVAQRWFHLPLPLLLAGMAALLALLLGGAWLLLRSLWPPERSPSSRLR
jgi:hypothetical protein